MRSKNTQMQSWQKSQKGRETQRESRDLYTFFSFVFSFNPLLLLPSVFSVAFSSKASTSIEENRVIKYSINFDTTRYGRLITIIMWLFHCASAKWIKWATLCDHILGVFFLFCYCCYSPFCLRILFFHLHWDYSRIYLMRRSDTRKYPPAVSFDELIEWVLLSQSMSIAVLIFSPDYLLNLTFIWELLLSAYMQIWCLCTFRVCIHVYCVLRTDTRRRAKT